MELMSVAIDKPETLNFILGQTHFIKTVEDLHEALVELATKNALAIAAGHTFLIFLGEGFYPINVLNAVKNVPEVCHIFCATANPTQVIIAESAQGRGILGVIDGFKPKGS